MVNGELRPKQMTQRKSAGQGGGEIESLSRCGYWLVMRGGHGVVFLCVVTGDVTVVCLEIRTRMGGRQPVLLY